MKPVLVSAILSLVFLGGCASMGGPGHRMHGGDQHGMPADCPMHDHARQGEHGMAPGGPMPGHGPEHCPMAQDQSGAAQDTPDEHAGHH